MYMRVISRRALNELGQRYPEAKVELDAWFHEAEAARWGNPAQIKEQYGSASILKGSRVVFNICGNKYRLVVKINFNSAQPHLHSQLLQSNCRIG